MTGRDAEQFTDTGYGESSQYAAHLDRGWALLDRGDLDAARTSVIQAQELRPDDPDAAVLLGAIALAEGKPEDSLRCYERAIELDPEYLEPYTAAAQVCLFELDDAARALRLCNDAAELEHIGPFESVDLHLLAAEAELTLGDEHGGRRRLQALPELGALEAALDLAAGESDPSEALEHGDPDMAAAAEFLALDQDGEPLDEEERGDRVERAFGLAMRLARLRLDLGETEEGLELVRRLVERFPGEADAWYFASESEQRGGDLRRSAFASLRTLQLDGQRTLPEWLPTPGAIHERITAVLGRAPDAAIREIVHGGEPLAVIVEELPSPELVAEGVDPRLPALALAARALEAAGSTETPLVLTGLAIYVRNIVRYARDAEQFDDELRLAVYDELAAFFGLPDDRREALGLSPAVHAHVPTGEDGGAGGGGEAAEPEAVPPEDEPDDGKRRRRRRRSRAAN